MANTKEFPLIVDMLPAAQELIDWLTGSSTLDTHCLVWDAWTVEGFIAGQIWKHPAEKTNPAQAGPPQTNGQKAAMLRAMVEKCQTVTSDPVGMDIPWVALWLLVRDLIDQLLGV